MEITPVTTACYENAIPSFVAGNIEQLYGSMYASFAHFDLYGGLNQASTYVTTSDQGLQDILLYRKDKQAIHVLNEQMRLDGTAIERFASTMFGRYPDVDMVSLHAIHTAAHELPYPAQRYTCTNDIIMPLPATVDAYYGSLGKSTRKTLNQNGNRLQRRHASFQFQVLEAADVTETQLTEIIALNRVRMAGKSRISAIDDTEASNIIAFAKRCGLVGLVSIDGKICAGAICYRIGSHYHLRVIGHDPQYNTYGLGMWCCYRTICECIVRGGTQFHFMWGQEEYKYRLLGVQCELAHIVVYRSRLRMLAHANLAARTAFTGWRTQAHMWMLERLRHKDHWAIRCAHKGLTWMRSGRRLFAGTEPAAKDGVLQLSQKE